MSSPPQKDHRGEGSYQDRLKNYQEEQRQAQVRQNAQRTMASGLEPGPSGKPKVNFIATPSRARAEDAARSAGHGHTPVRDTAHAPGQKPHFHVTDASGQRGDKNSPHVTYPQKNSSLPSPKL